MTSSNELRYYPNNGAIFSGYTVTGQGWNAITTLP